MSFLFLLAALTAFPTLDGYNPVWTSQSKNAAESMPLGGGDVGANVWVENGEILIYLQRSGTFDENNAFLKQGRVRVRLEPNPFASGQPFRQELKLRSGCIEIQGADTVVHGWVEVHRPIVHIDIESKRPVSAFAQYESWRTADRELPDNGSRFGCFGWDAYPGKVFSYRDTVEHLGNAVVWYHRNRNDKLIFDAEAKQQGLEAVRERLWNPLRDLTFGGMLMGAGFVADGQASGRYLLTDFAAWKLRSAKPAGRHSLSLYFHTAQAPSVKAWRSALEKLAAAKSPAPAEAWRKNGAWWEDYWRRSWLLVRPNKPDSADPVWQLGRNYQLFRYMLASNAYGDFPTKFNGGLFTVDPHLSDAKREFNPDWRAWGGGSFAGQNQRLVYWPMLTSGDFDMMPPQFDTYRRGLGNATLLVKHYWGHGGARFAEQVNQYALPIAAAYGWPGSDRRPRPADLETGVQVNRAVGNHFESQLEFAYMILRYFAFSGRDIALYMPFIEESVRFYDEHYQYRARQRTGSPLDVNGRLIIHPSQALETYANATNPVSVIAGLKAVLAAMLALPEKYATEDKKRQWRAVLERVPPLPIKDGIVQPAESYTGPQNVEMPQFYPLFPFNLSGLGQPDLDLYINTWKKVPWTKGQLLHTSWHQNGIFLARMGLTGEAADYAMRKMRDSDRRFPAFWGPGHDWVPDHNWGGSGMINLQEMLMQTDDRAIRLFPAWPNDWDVDFRLHAPQNTVVRCLYRNGEVVSLEVTPPSRTKDVQVMRRQ
jgi:hypothetical protein